MSNTLIPATAEGLPKITRRLFLRHTAAAGAASAAVAVPATATAQSTPDDRIRAAMQEIEAAMSEKYPGWGVQVRNDVSRPVALKGREWVELEPVKHAVVIFASEDRYGPEEVRWFTVDRSPLLADDVTGTSAFADWEATR